MRGHFARNPRAPSARLPYLLDCIAGAEVREVPRFAGLSCDSQIAPDDHLFRLAVYDEWSGKIACEVGRFAQQLRIFDRIAVVGKRDRPRFRQRGKVARLRAFAPARDRPNRHNAASSITCDFTHQPVDRGWIVERGVRVRHTCYRRETAAYRRFRPRCDRLFLWEPRLAQVNVHIDESWCDDGADGIEDRFVAARFEMLPDFDNGAGARAQIPQRIEGGRRIDDPTAFDQQPGHRALTSRSRTAIRTATPCWTCLAYRQPAKSNTESSSSTPRL